MTSPAPVSFADVQKAAFAIAGTLQRTPLVAAPALSARLGCTILLKLETQQATGSFKERGALVKLAALTPDERRRGVIACSAGNHAQGVAYHARRLAIAATIVMPQDTPFSKVARTEAHGATVRLAGRDLDAAEAEAQAIAARDGLVFVHPYDDPLIVAGQGTCGLEMLEDDGDLDILVVPIGGGGLIAGIATAAKAMRPEISVVGVQAALYPAMRAALFGSESAGAAAPARGGTTIAEGIAVKRPGTLTRAIVRRLVDDILLVEEWAIEMAVHQLIESQKLVAEGAGAAGIAALIAHPDRFRDKRVGVVICGGNIDSRLLAVTLLRGLMRDNRMVSLRVEIPDQPGALSRVTGIVGAAGGNIVEIVHQRLFHDVPVKMAEVDMVVETRNGEHVRRIVADLAAEGFPVRPLASVKGP